MGRSTTLAYIAMGALGLSAVLSLAGLSVENSYHHLVQQAIAGKYVSPQTAQSAEHHVHTIGWLELGLYAVTGVVFIAWFRNAYTNVERLRVTGLRWSAGWAVGAWFVPFLNLVRPKAIINDIWRGSDPRLPVGGSLSRQGAPTLYGFWWGTWILGAIVGRVAGANFGSAPTLSALSSASQELMFSDFVSLVAAILAIAVVYSLTSRQRQRAMALAPPLGLPSLLQDGMSAADSQAVGGTEMTITLGRLLAVIAAVAALIAVSAVYLSRSHGGSSPTFESEAGRICQEQLSAIKAAPDLPSALAASRTMRSELSALTPPPTKRATFDDWMRQLSATEDAVIRGDSATAQEADLLSVQDAQRLGLSDCITTRG